MIFLILQAFSRKNKKKAPDFPGKLFRLKHRRLLLLSFSSFKMGDYRSSDDEYDYPYYDDDVDFIDDDDDDNADGFQAVETELYVTKPSCSSSKVRCSTDFLHHVIVFVV